MPNKPNEPNKPNKDKTCPAVKGPITILDESDCTMEGQLEKTRGKSVGPSGNGAAKSKGKGKSGARRKDSNGITYFT